MDNQEQQYLKDLENKLWNAADKLRATLEEIKKNLAGLGYEH